MHIWTSLITYPLLTSLREGSNVRYSGITAVDVTLGGISPWYLRPDENCGGGSIYRPSDRGYFQWSWVVT